MKNLKGKRLLILGGSMWKEAIEQYARENEIVLIATGNNRGAGIFDIADECYDVDSTDIVAMKKLIVEQSIDGVYMGGSEPVISAACVYINELKLPCYCTTQQWQNLQNKNNFKKLCRDFELPVVPQYDASYEELSKLSQTIDYPVITKPTDGCGSSGFSICNNLSELKDGYNKAQKASSTGGVLIEKLVKNSAVVVFYTASNGKLYFSGIEDKYPVRFSGRDSFVGGAFVFESKRKEIFRHNYESKIQRMFNSIGIKEGSIWIEVFVDGDNYYFNEMGYRYGGSVSIYPVDYFYGYNQVAADIYYSLTNESCIEGFPSLISDDIPRKKHYCVYPIILRGGVVNKVIGFDNILRISTVVAVPSGMKIGKKIEDSATFSQTFALLHFVFDTKEEFNDTIRTALKDLCVIDENGENMILSMFSPEEVYLDL